MTVRTSHVLLLVAALLALAALLKLFVGCGRVLETGNETFDVVEAVVQNRDVALVAIAARRRRVVVAFVFASDVLSVLRGLERLSSRSSDGSHVLRTDFLGAVGVATAATTAIGKATPGLGLGVVENAHLK